MTVSRPLGRGGSALTVAAPLLGGLLALVLVSMFVVLDYRFEQAPHRLIKILAGGVLVSAILIKPRIGLVAFPVITPFLGWIPPLPIPGVNPLNGLLGSVFLTWALHRVLTRQDVFRQGRLTIPLFVLVVLAALSIVRGAAFPTGYFFDGLEASLQLFRVTVGLGVYVDVLAMARGGGARRTMAWAIVIGLLAEAVTTIALGRNGRGARAEGSIGQSNELGAFLALYAVLAASLLVAARSFWARTLLLVTTVTATYGVVLSVSRGAIVALGLGLGFVALRSSRWMTFLLIAVAVTAPFWTPQYLKDRMLGTHVEVEGTDEAMLENSAQLRVDTWRAIWRLVTEHPLEGVGFTGLTYVLPETGDALGIEVKDSSHNTFLRMLGEMGIAGLSLFIFLLWRCWKLGSDGVRRARDAFDRQLAIGLMAATLVLTVSCAFGDRFLNVLITGGFWILCALVDDLVLEPKKEEARA